MTSDQPVAGATETPRSDDGGGVGLDEPTTTSTGPPKQSPDLRDRLRASLPWVGDALALLILTWAIWWLSDNDGGFAQTGMAEFALATLATAPIAVIELRRADRKVVAGVALWGVGLCLSLLFALDRSQFVKETMTLATMPLVGLVAARLWRRTWGPVAILAVFTLGFAAYWHRSFLQWWGKTMLGGQPTWLALSWRNQSGMLMVAFGMFFLVVAMSTRRVVRAAGVLLAAGAFAGVWLSSSRGAVLFMVFGALLAVAVLMATGPDRRSVAIRSLAVVGMTAALTVVVTAVLLAMIQSSPDAGDVTSPLASREEQATANFLRRFEHMEAGLEMFAARPLTGMGPGSYGPMAVNYTDGDANLTSAAHNEYVEAFAENGLLFGLAVLGLVGFAVSRSWRVLTAARGSAGHTASETSAPSEATAAIEEQTDAPGGRTLELDQLRHPVVIAVVVMVALLTLHAAIDFDWGYPILPFLWMTGIAVIWRASPSERSSPTWVAVVALVPLLLAVVAGFAGSEAETSRGRLEGLSPTEYAEATPPWRSSSRRAVARRLMEDRQYEAAALALDGTKRWNPGDRRIDVDEAELAFRSGQISAEEYAAALPTPPAWLSEHVRVANVLLQAGELALADEVAETLIGYYDGFAAWSLPLDDAWAIRIQVAVQQSGCEAARAMAGEAVEHPWFASKPQRETYYDDFVDGLCESVSES